MRIPPFIGCPYCGKPYERAAKIIKRYTCVYCRRNFLLWDATFYGWRGHRVIEVEVPRRILEMYRRKFCNTFKKTQR